jgi:NAD(P)-dependent dehydrogenase (short-subunit alcohol dehydrogenase family)
MKHMSEVLIWGASGGIGRALVRHLKVAGWRVFAAARNINKIPVEADFQVEFDAKDRSSIDRAALAIAQETDGVDLVVYAAGGLESEKLHQLSQDDWSQVIDSNLNGAYFVAAPSLNLMKEDGHMVFFGAYGDHLILPKMGAYAVAKAGLEPFVKILAKENRKNRFTLIRPGAVDTPFWENAPFKLPPNAKSPDEIVIELLKHHDEGGSGELNL